jgi:MerR family transcriptional regulator, light-induced transcriptional regulator
MAFSIKELAALSGIKAHTIRIWEQRYNFLKPDRTSTNIRTYSNEELKTLLTVSLLNKYGYKISRIDEMPANKRLDAVLSLSTPEAQKEYLLNKLISCTIDLKSMEFERLLNKYIDEHGLTQSIQLIFQFLERIGLLWQSNKVNPAQEHIASNIIRQKIISGIDRLPLSERTQPTVLLFLPEYEHHELGLLFVYYMLREKEINSIYLGANVPLKDLQYIIEVKKPDYIYTHLIAFPRQLNLEKFTSQLSGRLYETQVLLSGPAIISAAKKFPAEFTILQSFAEVLSYISKF